ncbi:Ig-like domain-containing protein [Nocardioides marmorisolisilvae]|uniref:Ig-like domain repeat protein n=1 Tax=Nocardioides marmorisolisilvae TaxID=1542737 RepID=A0A3N0DUR9_9ACTN|nr:Ig-like domain-containing protein [Nocardioides marmorisolisilvae]RNL79153.1 Ig-like domain repeat protein [Nocardioides marmorisolisilvae]
MRKTLGLALAGALAASFATVVATTAPAAADVVVPATFGYTGGEQVWNVPANVTAVHITAVGARGGDGGASGNTGGQGTVVNADLPIPAGVTKLYVHVGQDGSTGSTDGTYNGGSGGGGGAGPFGGSGGGGTDVRTCPEGAPCDTLGSRLVVAGGGGGGGGRCVAIGCAHANNGGDATDTAGGNGGIALSGGPGFAGGVFAGGIGGVVVLPAGGGGGGGGGGWYGGGGGAGGDGIGSPIFATGGGNGGRGSDHVTPTATSASSELTDQPAQVTISYIVRSTTITYTGPAGGDMNTSVPVSAKLTSALGPINGATLNFSLDGGGSCSGVTNAAGVASCTLTPAGPAGAHTISISYGGLTNAFLPTAASAPFQELKRPTTMTYTGATTSPFHHAATVSGVLTTTDDHQPVPGATVSFTLNGSETCSATTDSAGAASCSLTPNEPQGTYAIVAAYGGDASHLPSMKSTPFKVTVEPTVLTYVGPATVANDEPATLSAKLTEDIGPPVVGRNVTIKLGSGLTAQSCTGPTNTSGIASCTIPSVHQPLNAAATLPVGLTFAGDNFYMKSTGSSTIGLQYMTGRAFAVQASVIIPGLQLTIKPTPDTGNVRTAVPFTKAPACVLAVNGKIGVKTLCAKVVAGTAPGRITSTSSIAGVTVSLPNLPVIAIGAVNASSATSCAGSVGQTTVASVTIGGTAYNVALHPEPNFTIPIPGTAAKLVLNEQSAAAGDHGMTVTAVDLVLPGPGTSGIHVALATATSAIHNCTS